MWQKWIELKKLKAGQPGSDGAVSNFRATCSREKEKGLCSMDVVNLFLKATEKKKKMEISGQDDSYKMQVFISIRRKMT